MFDQDLSVMIKSERFNSMSHLVGAVLALAGYVRQQTDGEGGSP